MTADISGNFSVVLPAIYNNYTFIVTVNNTEAILELILDESFLLVSPDIRPMRLGQISLHM